MIKVRFLCDRDVLDGAGRVVQSFRSGEVVSLPASSARRWAKRGVAVEVPYDTLIGQPTVSAAVMEPEPGESQSQPEPSLSGSEAGEDQPSSSPEADQASAPTTSRKSVTGKWRGRQKKGG